MLLAVNVGNTNTAFAVYDGERLRAEWRAGSEARRTADEYSVLLASLARRSSVSLKDLSDFALCSVIPAATTALTGFARTHLKIADPFVLRADADLGITIHYEPKTDVGADRLANAVGAYARYGGPVIVVDLGTATTFDAVSAEGDYLGGAIAPGIEIAADALVSRTAQLRRVPLTAPPKAIGSSTLTSLQSGIVYGFAGQVDALVERFQAELGGEARVVATGGLAEVIAPHSRTIKDVDPRLTLEGLRLAYERYKARV